MTNTIWDKIADTPWWYFLAFAFLVHASFLATKPRVIHVRSIFLSPIIPITLSIFSIHHFIPMTTQNIAAWLDALVLGVALGWLQFYISNIQAILHQPKIYIPGTWQLFIIVMAAFSAKIYYGFTIGFDPNILSDPDYAPIFMFAYGLITGLFCGRLTYSVQCIKSGPYSAHP